MISCPVVDSPTMSVPGAAIPTQGPCRDAAWPVNGTPGVSRRHRQHVVAEPCRGRDRFHRVPAQRIGAVGGHRVRVLAAALRAGIARRSHDDHIAVDGRVPDRGPQHSLILRFAHRHARHHTDVDHLDAQVRQCTIARANELMSPARRISVGSCTSRARPCPNVCADWRTDISVASGATPISPSGPPPGGVLQRHRHSRSGSWAPRRRLLRRRLLRRRRRRWRRRNRHRGGDRWVMVGGGGGGGIGWGGGAAGGGAARTAHGGRGGSGAPDGAAPISDATTVPCASQSSRPSPYCPIT